MSASEVVYWKAFSNVVYLSARITGQAIPVLGLQDLWCLEKI